ncbi:MAG: hypothetical protein K0S74_54 [Chlamydiales bacterium]|jgi:YfiH family protein|nr:hypothetical protein [Chlamydiales bacterium]
MIEKKLNDTIKWLEFNLLQGIPNLKHGVFLRHGGISPIPYSGLNVGLHTGDDIKTVIYNRSLIENIVQSKLSIYLEQLHGINIIPIDKTNAQESLQGDGLITEQNNIALVIQHADCQAAIFYDPVNHVIANIHCGWKGNVQNIYAKTIEKMGKIYGSLPQNLLVCISPSLGPEASEFINYKREFPEYLWKYQVKPFYFDLWEASKQQLMDSGVLPEHIEIAQLCTYSDVHNFYSYRRDKVTGRHATVVMLKK